MPATSPVRVDDELYRSASLVGDTMSRSAAQQITPWARIGRALEASPDVSAAHIAEVLTGDRDDGTLDSDEQALVRAMWAERFGRLHQQLDLAVTFAAEGHTDAELDDDGTIVTVAPSAAAERAALIADAVDAVDEIVVYDNSRARPAFRVVARFGRGRVVGVPDWPWWTPDALRALTR